MSSRTESAPLSPGGTKLRSPRPLVAGITAILLVGAILVVEELRPGSHAAKPIETPVPNFSGAVPLSDFADHETLRWHSVPRGTQVCENVAFICNGAIRTAGLRAARDGKRYPGAVVGVPVNRRGNRIRLLQAAENATEMGEALPYSRIQLHYANEQTRDIELLLGVHGDDWLQPKNDPNEPLADPNSRVGWTQRRTGDGAHLRLYLTTLENPFPDVPITSVDFISPLTEANLLLFGLTVEDDPKPLPATYGQGETLGIGPVRDTIQFTVEDSLGGPALGATLEWTLLSPRLQIDFPPFRLDAQGHINIDVPRRLFQEIRYKARRTDGSGTSGIVKVETSRVFPRTVVVRMGKDE